ncbi:MAG: hypothetical protein J4224_00250 [Candidatus Diapherotrites archaeon]|uniref:Uncharacterized protein n=1 Tax=Candidatus Iainarchaeum sp. TaxID=3101447 RepID=A0A8T4L1R9_9ARCH|nr:MAG: hypothetical protein QT03_C0001G1073 [archaeon GW2011_AR10]MBS3058840.1 hypothetical protein [Candidatus Diapherotrites archaeon]
MVLRGYFIQYKFIVPESIKHSSYTYQKLFRALYGYTQNVTKSNGKSYKYHRRGVLSSTPYIRPGKNCVIIPPGTFNPLIDFFKTGKNPSHYWQGKGDWKAVYYMDEKNLTEDDVRAALEEQLDRTYIVTNTGEHKRLIEEIAIFTQKVKEVGRTDKQAAAVLLSDVEKVVQSPWFKELPKSSKKLSEFYANYRQLKALL